MILTQLTLSDFRSYARKKFIFSPGVSLIEGPNASGKTNILEAIAAIAVGKSFRAEKDSEMVKWHAPFARIHCLTEETKLELIITTGLVNGQKTPVKKYLVNGISRRAIDFAGQLRVVLFWPEDLELVTDSPSIRRRYLDRVLVQTDREYRRNLLSYERGLRQRNRLLDLINEGSAQRPQLLFWDQLLIKSGGYLTDTRAAYIDYINRTLIPEKPFRIVYDKSIISATRLDQYKEEEVAAKATLVGPHRDDFTFQLKPKSESVWLDLGNYGSRGEQRMGVLWLKLAELTYITDTVNNRPLLLLDDIFSELDEAHRELVMKLIRQHQVIITSAESETGKILSDYGITFERVKLPFE